MSAEMPDYKDTVFLPKTDFPMRAGLPKREPEWLERWARLKVYDTLRARAAGREPFILHDGPPYANGHLHIGHGLNKILKDMIVRSQQMLGRDSRYVPGWDCHGLPIEWKIEEQYRQKGRNKDEVPVLELRQECRKFAEGWIDIQREEFQRLGITGKWDDPYLTMNFHAEAVIAEEFMKFLMNGALYQGSKPVLWSPVEKTALAEAEVEYHDKESFTVWVRFKVNDDQPEVDFSYGDVELRREGDAKQPPQEIDLSLAKPEDMQGAEVVIWTTTPWTMPSNKGIVFSATVSYGVYEVVSTEGESWAEAGNKFVLADSLADGVLEKGRVTEFKRLGRVPQHWLKFLEVSHPLAGLPDAESEWDQPRVLLDADFVTEDEGTGFVHCAPSHGMEEFEMYRDLGMLQEVITYNVLEDGAFRDDLPFFGGKKILRAKPKNGSWEGDANAAVMAKLAEVGGLLARGKIKHSYPHSWRSKAPLIYRNTPQWFAAIDTPVGGNDTYGKTIRERALTSIDELVTWTPKTGRNRLYSMIESRPDWVLSRQRAWGVPLTCFIKTGAKPTDPDFLLRDAEVNARIAAAFEAEGADCWYADGAKERFLGNSHDPDAYEQIFDILDVWFDSGSTHAFVLRDREDGNPDGIADVYLEGTDQHRGWFHSSMLQACGTKGRAPYKAVVTHGFTLDEKGMKMSKSLGNTIVPAEVTKQYGADILRLWVTQTDYTADQRIGPEILKNVADSYRRLRNTLRFLVANLEGFDCTDAVDPANMPELERWVLHRLAELDVAVREGYAAFDFQSVFQQLFQFATVDLSSFYFDIRKDALYCDALETERRRACRTVLELVLRRLTTWLAPMLVFTAEDVWLHRYPSEDDSVHFQDFEETPDNWRDDALAAKWTTLRRVRRVVTGALEVERTEKRIGSSLEAAPVVHIADEEVRALVQGTDFKDLCITSGIVISAHPAPTGAFTIEEITGVAVVAAPAEGEKCQRCWKILPDVGTHAHPATCARCNAALG